MKREVVFTVAADARHCSDGGGRCDANDLLERCEALVRHHRMAGEPWYCLVFGNVLTNDKSPLGHGRPLRTRACLAGERRARGDWVGDLGTAIATVLVVAGMVLGVWGGVGICLYGGAQEVLAGNVGWGLLRAGCFPLGFVPGIVLAVGGYAVLGRWAGNRPKGCKRKAEKEAAP